MGTIKADTISNKAGTGPIVMTGQSAAKAWGHFNGTGTPAFDDSFNMSSLTDNGVGDFSPQFTSLMSAAKFPVLVATGSATINPSDNAPGAVPVAAGSCRVELFNSGAVAQDREFNSVAVWGDLA